MSDPPTQEAEAAPEAAQAARQTGRGTHGKSKRGGGKGQTGAGVPAEPKGRGRHGGSHGGRGGRRSGRHADEGPARAGDGEPEQEEEPTAQQESQGKEENPGGKGRPGKGNAGREPGSGDSVPGARSKNNKNWADHAFITADHVDQGHTKEMLTHAAREAFHIDPDDDDPEHFKGVAVEEVHEDGSLHIHVACVSELYHTPRCFLDRGRAADERIRGWKEKPEYKTVEVGKGGKAGHRAERNVPLPGTGQKWHFNILFHHVYMASDSSVINGYKQAGGFAGPWPYNEMVDYLLNPVKEKHVDPEPFFINCTADTVHLDESELQPKTSKTTKTFFELVRESRSLTEAGVMKGDMIEQLSETVTKENAGFMPFVMQASDATEPLPVYAFVPDSLKEGRLETAKHFQVLVCEWIENGPVTEAGGLFIKAARAKTAFVLISGSHQEDDFGVRSVDLGTGSGERGSVSGGSLGGRRR